MNRKDAELQLKKIFGKDHFYDEQWKGIERILNGERILMIQRTGFGKSLCYQFPATQFDGVTVVFSPLIALMRDQVKNLCDIGIPAAYINSEQSYEDNQKTIESAINGDIKILYIAPERQESNEWIEATRRINLSMVVIDEAHTISTWGHDFRPAFKKIINLVQLLPKHLPILAVTATATKKVQKDIENQIGGQLTTIRGSLVRTNLSLQVAKVQSEDEKMIWLASNINKFEGIGLIYTGTRTDAEIYAKWLQFMGVEAIEYHAGLDADTRKDIENGLMHNKWKCIVSTNALGMGIDKPDIRFIIHTQIPVSPIHYYQEIGRAGRDGKSSIALLFYNEKKVNGVAQDSILPHSFIENARPSIKKYNSVISILQDMPLSEKEITKKANLKLNQVKVIKADLLEQNIVKEVMYGDSKKYEYQYNAPSLDMNRFDEIRKIKEKELYSMEEYVYTDMPRMKYLCSFLDSEDTLEYKNCDNTNLEKIDVKITPNLTAKLEEFRESYFPILKLSSWTTKYRGFRVSFSAPNKISVQKIIKDENIEENETIIKEYNNYIDKSDYTNEEWEIIERHLEKASRLVDGYAASYYGVSNIGSAIHRSKYENGGDFPDFLLKKTLSVFFKKFNGVKFDLLLYLPSTKSGNLVKNFATKFAQTAGIQISHDLIKVRETNEQKIFQNSYNKRENVEGAFDIDDDIVRGKTIVVLDDIYDSGATIKEIGNLLTKKGANCIVPLVIAKTLGGTL